MRYRSDIEIVSEILKAANGDYNTTRTRIRYQALLNYNQLKEHLLHLTEKDLLRYDGYTQTFKTTEKGLRFLNLYNKIDQLMNE